MDQWWENGGQSRTVDAVGGTIIGGSAYMGAANMVKDGATTKMLGTAMAGGAVGGFGLPELQRFFYWTWDNILDPGFKAVGSRFAQPAQAATQTPLNEISQDPNALTGPVGYGTPNFVQPSGIWPYLIDFENDGSVAAQDVTITEQLDPNLDWTTFQLGAFGFGPVNITIPAGLTHIRPPSATRTQTADR